MSAREYRAFRNVLWGEHYNPETQAHHCFASDAAAALMELPTDPLGGYSSMQVRVGDEWRWVTESPRVLGGIGVWS